MITLPLVTKHTLFARWLELDRLTWNGDPGKKSDQALYREMEELERELRARYGLMVKYNAVARRYTLADYVESRKRPTSAVRTPKPKPPAGRFRQQRRFDAGGSKVWYVVDTTGERPEQGPFTTPWKARAATKRLNRQAQKSRLESEG